MSAIKTISSAPTAAWVRLALTCTATLLCFATPQTARAQLSTTASINGTITDTSGAAVSGASVTAVDQNTQVSTNTTSNEDGGFVLPGLPVGTYKVTVSKTGFSDYRATGIILHPATVSTVNVVMKPGEVTTSVSVEASAAQVEIATSEISNQVESAQVSTLPLNGRNFQALAAVMPGAVNTSAGSSLGTGGRSTTNVLSVNGLGQARTFYALDGIWNENTGNMNQNTVVPNPDTLEEVRVLQNNYSTRYALMGSSVVLLQTKSGTSSFHGNAFEYFRNDALNARNFFTPTVSSPTAPAVPPYKQNIFGYNVGGPVFIPGHYNTDKQKTFFFWSQQWVKLHTPVTPFSTGQTVTSAEFTAPYQIPSSKQLFIPGTGTRCPYPQTAPGSGIYVLAPGTPPPAGCPAFPAVNANSIAFLKALYPAPNFASTGANNFINEVPQITDQRDDEIKLDHNFSSKFRLMGEYLDEVQTFRQSSFNATQSGSISPLSYESDETLNKLAQVSLTALISPTMVNTTSIAMNIFNLNLNLAGIGTVDQIPGFQESLPFNGFLSNRVPQVGITNFMSVGIPQARPLKHAADLDDTVSDDWSWLHGKHYLQAGVNIVFNTKRQNQTGPSISGTAFGVGTNGEWSFTGIYTGNGSGSGSGNGASLADFLLGDAASFTQSSDQIRAAIHGRIISPYIEDRFQVTRRLTLNAGLRTWHMPLPHPPAGLAGLFEPSQYNPAQAPAPGSITGSGTITPPAGSYNPINGLVRNGVNGVPLNWTNGNNWYFGPMVGFALDVFGDGKTSLRGGYGITYTKIFTNQDCSFNCVINPPAVQSVNLTGSASTPLTFPNPTGGAARPTTVQALNNADLDIKATSVKSYSASVQHEFPHSWVTSIAGAGSLARHLVGTWNYNQPLPVPGFDFPAAIVTSNASPYAFAPYYGYAAIATIATRLTQNWNALEIGLRHPVTNNLFLTASYTWSHNLTNLTGTGLGGSNVLSIYNPKLSYGNAEGLNYANVFTLSAVWNLPWYRNTGGFKGNLLGGWRYSDLTTVRSGTSLTPGISGANSGFPARPNLVSGQSINSGPQTIAAWFNTAAFKAPPAGFIGNAGTGSIAGPKLVNFDMALYKEFHIRESHAFEFRAEAFNIFNHTNFSNPNTTFGSSTFGQITSARDPRILELVLRYQF